jgi:hypothetical protein
MRHTFAVGRLDGGKRELVWVRPRRDPAFPGPWTVRAVVGVDDGSRRAERISRGGATQSPSSRRPEGEEVGGGAVSRGRPQLDLFG